MLKGFYYIIIGVLLLSIILFSIQKRMDLPFQEVVVSDHSIVLINARNWYADQIDISIYNENDHIITNSNYDKKGVCIVANIQREKVEKIILQRKDLKGKLLYRKKVINVPSDFVDSKDDRYIVLVGASVGSGWQFDRLIERIHHPPDIVLGFRPHYFFDKTETIKKLTELPVPVYSVIIKECSAYFPRNIDKSIKIVEKWIALLEHRGIHPVLTTAVPVTEKRDRESPGKMKSLLKYNDAIRNLAVQRSLPLLDLEKVLRISDQNRHLREAYAQSDGTHLLAPGYKILDQMMENKLESLVR